MASWYVESHGLAWTSSLVESGLGLFKAQGSILSTKGKVIFPRVQADHCWSGRPVEVRGMVRTQGTWQVLCGFAVLVAEAGTSAPNSSPVTGSWFGHGSISTCLSQCPDPKRKGAGETVSVLQASSQLTPGTQRS